MLKELQNKLTKLNRELTAMQDHDAPEQDIALIKADISAVVYQIMKICRGEY